jgi:hypothetical protein
MAAKKKTSKKKKSFVLSDEELDKVSGGAGATASPAVRAIGVRAIQIKKGLPGGGIGAEPFQSDPQTPMRINRSTIPGAPGGHQM